MRGARSSSAILSTCMNFSPYSALLLLPAMILLLQLGHSLRLRQKTAPQSSAIEGAVFALFGLLLAFTFSGAVARYDAHRQLLLEESNDIGTAYLRPVSYTHLDVYKRQGTGLSTTAPCGISTGSTNCPISPRSCATTIRRITTAPGARASCSTRPWSALMVLRALAMQLRCWVM